MNSELDFGNSGLRDWLEPPEHSSPGWFQKRGRVFEKILNEMLSKEQMEPRTSMHPSGEEIDGSFAIGDDFYLLEAKWHSSPIPASSLYAFKGKVDGKLTGTYHNSVFILSDGNGKMARRYARNADIEKLQTETPAFSHLLLKLRGASEETSQ